MIRKNLHWNNQSYSKWNESGISFNYQPQNPHRSFKQIPKTLFSAFHNSYLQFFVVVVHDIVKVLLFVSQEMKVLSSHKNPKDVITYRGYAHDVKTHGGQCGNAHL